jgi:hypothetical protein
MKTLKERTIDEINKDGPWSRKAVAINIFHNAMLATSPTWNYSDTARELNVSRVYVSENIRLARFMQGNPISVNFSRKRALIEMRKAI